MNKKVHHCQVDKNMLGKNNFFTFLIGICFLSLVFILTSFSQEVQPLPQEEAPLRPSQPMLPPQIIRSQEDRTKSLEERQRKERTELRERQIKERKEARERELQERKAAREKRFQERKAAREKRLQEKKEAREKLKQDKAKEKELSKKLLKIEKENYVYARKTTGERNAQIIKTKRLKRFVEVTTGKNDPVYISEAKVLNAKSQFLKIRNVEFKYELKIQNQTPKIINSILIVWERKIPFTESLTIAKEVKVSKPMIPYETRTVEYNELDSKREGELYTVRIARVIFEDGTQWTNQLAKK
ncbi:MAG: hypothetical protein HYY52_00840 [Candidatus Melainabacteria bacterium]|nr:hypothetical protein [Candidatus Melainabacteria bacterium]